MANRGTVAVGANGHAESGVSEQELNERIGELERLLGKKTLEAEQLREALAESKKATQLLSQRNHSHGRRHREAD